jgi:hypothetical protein
MAGRCILDVSIKPDDGKIVDVLIPFLYKEQRDNPIFTITHFLLNLLKGAFHSLINYYFTIIIINQTLNENGYETNFWTVSVCLFSNILLIVTIDLIIEMKFHNYIVWLLIIFLTIIVYIIFLLFVERMTMFNSVGTMAITFDSLLVWLNLIFVNGFCALFNFVILSFKTIFIKSIHNDIITIKEKDNLFHEYVKTFPEQIKKLLVYKGCYVESNENENKANKTKVNKTLKKHSSLRRVKMKRTKTNCVEFVGVNDDKERDIDIIDEENDNNKENKIDNDNEINIYNRRSKRTQTGKTKVNFDIQEYAKEKAKKINKNANVNKNHNIMSCKNVKLHNRESLLIIDNWDNKNSEGNNQNNKVINVKKNGKTKISSSPNRKSKEIDKKRVGVNNKKTKEESQRRLMNNFSVK